MTSAESAERQGPPAFTMNVTNRISILSHHPVRPTDEPSAG
jgi:hypothetical protein